MRSFVVNVFIVDVIVMSSSSQSYIMMRKTNLSSIINFNWFFSDCTD